MDDCRRKLYYSSQPSFKVPLIPTSRYSKMTYGYCGTRCSMRCYTCRFNIMMMNSDLPYQRLLNQEFEKLYGYDFSKVDPIPDYEGVNLLEDKDPDIIDIDYSSLDFENLDIDLPLIVKSSETRSEFSNKNTLDIFSVDETDVDHSEPSNIKPCLKKSAKPKKRKARAKKNKKNKVFIKSSGETCIALRTRASSRLRA
ncbi:unnamed protein product [Moneuplotes crassus]|uniref:Uncharacterized protein n=1 Tax=Euplotes crassus TaxID=5936 RepID=A0AAD1XX65_EUPCR|nr:unnamed protein product [Moneuplotes crassus]